MNRLNRALTSAFLLLTFAVGFTHAQDYDGMQLYAANCSNCHGIYGEGNGVVSPELAVVLLDLRYLSARNENIFPEDFVLQVVDGRELRVAHGPAGMPVWGVEFSKSEGYDAAAQTRVANKVQALADFLKQIQILE